MCKLLHLVSLNGNFHCVDQLITASKSSCKKLLSEEVFMLRKIVASSTNSRHTLLTISGKSLINITNSVDPSTEPCGIPLLTHAQDESSASTQTLCFLALKNDFIQLCTLPVIPKFLTFSRSL